MRDAEPLAEVLRNWMQSRQPEIFLYRNQADSPEAAQKNFRKMQVQFPET